MRIRVVTISGRAALAVAAVGAAVAIGWLSGALAAEPAMPTSDATVGSLDGPAFDGPALDDAGRRELAPAAVLPGTAPDGSDAAVDRTDPAAVARAYVIAAHSLTAADAGHTNRRGSSYTEPGAAVALGIVVLDAPPPGGTATAVVTELMPIGTDPSGDRRGYTLDYRIRTGSPGSAGADGPVRSRYLLLVRQGDGRWLVAIDTADPPNTGE